MRKTFVFAVLSAALLLAGCATSQSVIVPLNPKVEIEDTYTIIWNGVSQAYRFQDNNWVRDSRYDYVFDVIQKRYNGTWKSTKSLHRLHPDYDGKAGNRSQAMYFEVNYQLQNDALVSKLTSSLGQGNGSSDREFREQVLDFEVSDISSFAPYNHIRITQHYKYEEGVLEETVELFKKKDGKEIPFMKNEEKAYFYVKGKLPAAPTKM
jgi:hypothetical protein